MWYEKLGFTVDIEKIREQIVGPGGVLEQAELIIQGEEYESKVYNGFGGWSLTSRTGDYRDGWEVFHADDVELNKIIFPDGKINYKAMKFLGVSHPFEHDKPTQFCTGEIKKVIDQLEFMGFYPRRVRITCLKAGSKSLIHKDNSEDVYMARIHIPVVSNEACVHICEGEHLHMPADGGVYMMMVNNWHQIRNDSDEDRYHILMDAYDTKGLTKNLKYNGDINTVIQQSQNYRKNMDAAELTPQDLEMFEKLKEEFIANIPHRI